MDFVFMLTRDDRTVANALELVEIARPLRLRHIGFKDVGADASSLQRLTAAIREAGASPWMELVSTTRETELRGVELGRDLGVDRLLGGVHVDEALRILEGSAIRYLPFAGAPSGHPTRLGGAAPQVEAQCRSFATRGCAGVDILAYRATEAEPLDLVAACRRGFLSYRRGRGRRKRELRRNGSPLFAPRERTPSPSAPRRSTPPTRPAPDLWRRSSRRCSQIAARRIDASGHASGQLPPGLRFRLVDEHVRRPSFSLSAWRIRSCWVFGAMPPFGGSRSRLVGKE